MKLEIKGYKGHDSTLFVADEDRSVLVIGERGAGKTGILSAIKIGLLGYDPELGAVGKRAKPSSHLDFCKAEDKAIKVSLNDGEVTAVHEFKRHGAGGKYSFKALDKNGVRLAMKPEDWAEKAGHTAIYSVEEFVGMSSAAQLRWMSSLSGQGDKGRGDVLAILDEYGVDQAKGEVDAAEYGDALGQAVSWVEGAIKKVRADGKEARRKVEEFEDSERVDVDTTVLDEQIAQARADVAGTITEAEAEAIVAKNSAKLQTLRENAERAAKAAPWTREQVEADIAAEMPFLLSDDQMRDIDKAKKGAAMASQYREDADTYTAQLEELATEIRTHETTIESIETEMAEVKALVDDAPEMPSETGRLTTEIARYVTISKKCPALDKPCPIAEQVEQAAANIEANSKRIDEHIKNMERFEQLDVNLEVANSNLHRCKRSQTRINDNLTEALDWIAVADGIWFDKDAVERHEAAVSAIRSLKQRLTLIEQMEAAQASLEAMKAVGDQVDARVDHGGVLLANLRDLEDQKATIDAARMMRKLAKERNAGNVEAVEEWQRWEACLKALRTAQEENAAQVVSTLAEPFKLLSGLLFNEEVGMQIDKSSNLAFGVLGSGGEIIPWVACSKGQRVIVGACLRYAIMVATKAERHVLLIDDLEAVGLDGMRYSIGAASMAMALCSLDALVMAANDTVLQVLDGMTSTDIDKFVLS